MSDSEVDVESLKSKDRERLLVLVHPKRAGFLFNYVFGTVIFAIGILFNVAASGGYVEYRLVSWILGISAMLFGLLLVGASELRRRYTLYILTTWNARIRTGVLKKETIRIFYDEIERIEATGKLNTRTVNMGDVRIYSKKGIDEPFLIFHDIYNPIGIKIIIDRIILTTPIPPPWSHLREK